jgi:hypothetical protein
VNNTKQCCIGKGDQEGEVCKEDHACHQTSDSEGKVCQKIYDPSNCSLLTKGEVQRPWGYTRLHLDSSIGYGEVQLPDSVWQKGGNPGEYLQQTNCAGPGAFVLNRPWTPNCIAEDKACYARKAIDPNKVCASPPPQNTIQCNTSLDCAAKVNEQNCWKPNTGSCRPPEPNGYNFDSALAGMDPNDCRGQITSVDCTPSNNPADGGKGKCVFHTG